MVIKALFMMTFVIFTVQEGRGDGIQTHPGKHKVEAIKKGSFYDGCGTKKRHCAGLGLNGKDCIRSKNCIYAFAIAKDDGLFTSKKHFDVAINTTGLGYSRCFAILPVVNASSCKSKETFDKMMFMIVVNSTTDCVGGGSDGYFHKRFKGFSKASDIVCEGHHGGKKIGADVFQVGEPIVTSAGGRCFAGSIAEFYKNATSPLVGRVWYESAGLISNLRALDSGGCHGHRNHHH